MRSHVTQQQEQLSALVPSFNTASGMRSHVTSLSLATRTASRLFQYRKRYEITCDQIVKEAEKVFLAGFNTASGMRSHVTNRANDIARDITEGFNTASGMRSHVTPDVEVCWRFGYNVSIPQAV